MPRLQNDLSPVINIEDPADAALLFWKGHILASGTCEGTADALEFATGSLFNPLGSGKLLVVRKIIVGLGSDTWRAAFTQDRTGTVQTTLGFNDSRASLVAVPAGELGFDSLAVQPARKWMVARLATGGADGFPTFVLHPGVGVQIWSIAAADSIVVAFEWLERTAELPELEGL